MRSLTSLVRRLFHPTPPICARRQQPGLRPRLEPLEGRWLPSNFTITDGSDDPTDTGSLRFALNNLSAGSNTIHFAITSSTALNVGSVTGAPLPAITHQVFLDG